MGSNDTGSTDELSTGFGGRVSIAISSFAAVVFNVTRDCVLYSAESPDLKFMHRFLNPASWTSLLDHKSSTHDVVQKIDLLTRDNRSAR